MALARVAVILSASLGPSQNGTFESCPVDPCKGLDPMVEVGMVVWPFGIALGAWACAGLPVFLMGSRNKVKGIQGCLWALGLLWAGLLGGFGLFVYDRRALAYAWALHASTGVLSHWRPKNIRFPGLQRMSVFFGVLGVCWYAWQLGAPLGVAGWQGAGQAQCGWAAHLMACLACDVLLWAVS